MSELFLCEWPFSLDFDGDVLIVEYQVAHPKASVSEVLVIKEYNEQGHPIRERGYLLVRDTGDTSKMTTKKAFVVRRHNELTPLPAECGKLVRAFNCYGGRWSFYVFDAKEGSPSTRSTSAKTTTPGTSKAPDTSSPVASEPSPAERTNSPSPGDSTTASSDGWSGW